MSPADIRQLAKISKNPIMFELLGLDSDAENAYEAMVRNGPAAAVDLAATIGVKPARVRVLLRRLAERGLASRVPGTPARYAVVDPDIALDALLLKQEERLRRARVRAHELRERYHRESAGRDRSTLVEVIVGTDQVAQRVEQALRGLRRELRCFDKPPYATDPTLKNHAELDFLRDGGIARVLYERSALDIPGRLPDLETGLAHGEHARTYPQLPMKLIIVDDRLAILPLRQAPVEAIDGCVVVYRSSLLDAVTALFETYWTLAAPLGIDEPAGAPGAAPDGARLLALMTAGLSDAAIGRQLGISYRTLQRRIHDLMANLHSQTRFQLGVHAARRGLVPPSTK